VKVREILERQVEQLHRLITDLVDVTTRITKGRVVLQREHVDVNAILDDALGLVQARSISAARRSTSSAPTSR